MIEESLKTYRQERLSFILGLRHYYGIDFYKMDRRERTNWLKCYINYKREFFENLIEIFETLPPGLSKVWPKGYKFEKKRGLRKKSLI